MFARPTVPGALLLLSLSAAQAQTAPDLPPPPMSISGDSSGPGRKQAPLASMTTQWQRELRKDARVDKRGFRAVVVPAAFIGQLDAVKTLPAFVPVRFGGAARVGELDLLGSVEESKRRKNYLFGRQGRAGAMLTVWRYKEDGASYTVVSELLNQTVDGTPATLSLATTGDSRQCQWKLLAVGHAVSHEIVIADALNDKNEAGMTVAQVMATAKALVGFAAKQR